MAASPPAPASIDSLKRTICADVRDWSIDKRDAWLYGIIVGWAEAFPEVARRHGWSPSVQTRLLALRREFLSLAVP